MAHQDMAHYDAIFKNGTIANQDGVHKRRYRRPRRPHRGAGLARRPTTADRGHRLHGTAHPARCHRHAGAFPRARARAQGRPRLGLALGGDGRRHRRLRDAQHQPADHHARNLRGQDCSRQRADALRLRVLHRRHARKCCRAAGARAAAGLRRRKSVHGLVDRQPARGRRRGRGQRSCRRFPAAPRSTRRTSSGSRSASRCASRTIRARTRSGATPRRRCARPAGWWRWRTSMASASTCCIFRRPRRWCFSPTTRTWRRSK